MQLTIEQRQLLEGDEKRAQRNAPLMGWSDASRAPDWAKERIIQIRSAIVEKRAIPAPSGTYIAAAERRSLTAIGRTAVAFGKKLFSPSKPSLREDPEWQRTVQAAFRLLADNARAEEQRKAEDERISREVSAELFPWESRG